MGTSVADMPADSTNPEPIKPPNGNQEKNPATPIQCQIFQETLIAQAQSFVGLQDSINKLSNETRAQSHEFTALRDAFDNLTQELKLFRESLTKILARWTDMVLEEHQKQGQKT